MDFSTGSGGTSARIGGGTYDYEVTCRCSRSVTPVSDAAFWKRDEEGNRLAGGTYKTYPHKPSCEFEGYFFHLMIIDEASLDSAVFTARKEEAVLDKAMAYYERNPSEHAESIIQKVFAATLGVPDGPQG